MGATDVLSMDLARDAIGLGSEQAADGRLTRRLTTFVAASSAWLDAMCGPVVSRPVAALGVNTATTTLGIASERELDALRRICRAADRITIGTDADPWAIASGRRVDAVDLAGGVVSITGPPVTTDATHSIRQGFVATTDLVRAEAPQFIVAAQEHLGWLWRHAEGASSNNELALPDPMDTPARILSLLPDDLRPGIA